MNLKVSEHLFGCISSYLITTTATVPDPRHTASHGIVNHAAPLRVRHSQKQVNPTIGMKFIFLMSKFLFHLRDACACGAPSYLRILPEPISTICTLNSTAFSSSSIAKGSLPTSGRVVPFDSQNHSHATYSNT